LGMLVAIEFFGDPRLLPFGGKGAGVSGSALAFAPILRPISRFAAPACGREGLAPTRDLYA